MDISCGFQYLQLHPETGLGSYGLTEILKQYDALDERVGGIIADPDLRKFDPTTPLCTEKTPRTLRGV